MSLLQTKNLSAFYGDFQALFGIDVTVGEGETIAVIGANGAGKTTFLRSVAGALPVARESVVFDGEPIGGRSAHDMVLLGIAMVPEGRRLFPALRLKRICCSAVTPSAPAPGISNASTTFFRGYTICGTCPRQRCQADSSKWLRSVAA